MDIGMMGGIVAVLYAVLVTRNWLLKALAWSIWLFWVLVEYSGGRRGPVVFMVLPAIAFLYLRYQARVVEYGRKHSFLAYVVVGVLGLSLLFVVQIQGSFRNIGLGDKVDFSQVELTKSQGNLMFSEALEGFEAVPDHVGFFDNRFPGEGALRAIPETAFWFLLGPVPRALWPDKPSDDAMVWYNKLIAGTDGKEGTTISQGIVGHWYFRYGVFGVLEGAMLIGFLMASSERMLQNAAGRPMTILSAICLTSWLFRIYRNFYFYELYGPLMGVTVFIICVKIVNIFGAAPTPALQPDGE